SNLGILEHQVGSWGMLSDCVESGPAALALLRAAAAGEPYDAALLDLCMPGMDGIELARAIKADPAISAVRLVILASFGMEDQVQAALEAGVLRYLSKPVNPARLYDCRAGVMEEPGGEAGVPSGPAREARVSFEAVV